MVDTYGHQPRILVLGDTLLDRYWLGTANRLSPEAPIPTVKIDKVVELSGGAGNVAANLRALGAIVGCGLPEMGAPLPIKNRLMVGDRQLARWDEHDECAPLVKIQIGHWDAVVVADYCKGAVGTTVEKFVKSFCGRVFIDTKGNPACWREVSSAVMFPNLKEYTDYSNEYCAGFDHVVFKRGAQGLTETVLDRLPGGTVFNGRECSYPSWARFVRNVSGAGDTVVAAYAYATLVGYPDPLAFANAAAAVVVEKPFTATASLQEVLERLKEVGYPNAQCQLAA